jgi:hypothetical protein
MNPLISRLRDAIRALHGCESTHLHPVRVDEKLSSGVVWRGDVEVFRLKAHDRAHYAYAWEQADESGNVEPIVVLRIPPVETPAQAVAWALGWSKACC